jgi:hypothetical protein
VSATATACCGCGESPVVLALRFAGALRAHATVPKSAHINSVRILIVSKSVSVQPPGT